MTRRPRWRRHLHVLFWRIVNPPTRQFAGIAPWWVLLETTGCRSGRPRRTPLAAGTVDNCGIWLIAVHGRHAAWIHNIETSSTVRLRHRRRWKTGQAFLHPFDATAAQQFNRYARLGPRVLGMDPLLVYVTWQPAEQDRGARRSGGRPGATQVSRTSPSGETSRRIAHGDVI
jgi:deazaflavin-dependent oxidoreductase (nitroreductase family)